MRPQASLGGILAAPAHVRALVFDMDGVLLDTLGADHGICVKAAEAVLGDGGWITREAVRKYFALEPESFWRQLVKAAQQPVTADALAQLIARYDEMRASAQFDILPGVEAMLADGQARGMACAAASSNPAEIVEAMLEKAGLRARFQHVSALGAAGVRPKPAPDLYVQAAREIGIASQECLFIEDSVTGLQAGREANMGYAVAVATGPAAFATLAASGLADIVFDRFEAPRIAFFPNEPARKRLDTPNDFVSHMVEHIAWRIGAGIDLGWRNNDWRALGVMLGAAIAKGGFKRESAATLGMIDDGAAEVLIDRTEPAGLDFDTHASLPRQSVLDMRVEQLGAGGELLQLMEGLADGLQARLVVRICTFEDPHHSWEGAFRAIGICLARLRSDAE